MTIVETTPGCNATPRVLFVLEEIGEPYELVVRDDGHFLATYGVPGPCLVEDEFRLLEANPIIRYLARTRALGVLLPDDPRGQAEVDRWLEFAQLRVAMSVVQGKMDLVAQYLGVLDRQLRDREWLCGAFSAADCGYAPLAMLADRLPVQQLPHLQAYLTRLLSRPAWQRVAARLAPGT